MQYGSSADLLADIGVWAQAVRDRSLSEQHVPGVFAALEEAKAERLETEIDPFLVIMLCGPTAVGKSSLINRLAGSPISQVGVGATTRGTVIYVHAEDNPERLFEYCSDLGNMLCEPASVVRHTCDGLRGKVIIDTPDIDSVILQNREKTRKLVHCTDLVLFVVSPEKYKNLNAIRWIADQRGERAIAFVMNKWDAGGLGFHHAQRGEVLAGFGSELSVAGFHAPVLFHTTTLESLGSASYEEEDEFGRLVEWIHDGISQATAVALQARRRRAAWGRLAAKIAAATPASLTDHPFVTDLPSRIRLPKQRALEAAQVTALSVSIPRSAEFAAPRTPGLLGAWLQLCMQINLWWSAKLAQFPVEQGTLARSPDVEFRRLVDDLVVHASLLRFAFGPVRDNWQGIAAKFSAEVTELPKSLATQIAINGLRPSSRKLCGIVAHVSVELSIASALALAFWRLAEDFLSGHYAAGGLILSTSALLLAVIAIGHGASTLFFPSPSRQGKRIASIRLTKLVNEAWAGLQHAVDDHVAAVERLAKHGRDLLRACDEEVTRLSGETGEPLVERLFPEDRLAPILE